MITVEVLINGVLIHKASAHRQTERHKRGDENAYLVYENGSTVYHRYEDGAIPLAKKLLETLTSDSPDGEEG